MGIYTGNILKSLSIIVPPLITIINVFFKIKRNLKNKNFNVTVTNPENNYNTLRYFNLSDKLFYSDLILIFSAIDIYIFLSYILKNKIPFFILIPFYIITILSIPFVFEYLFKNKKFTCFYFENIKYFIIGNRDQDDFYICQTLEQLKSSLPNKKYKKIEKNKVINFETEIIQMSNFKFKSFIFTIIKMIFYKLKIK